MTLRFPLTPTRAAVHRRMPVAVGLALALVFVLLLPASGGAQDSTPFLFISSRDFPADAPSYEIYVRWTDGNEIRLTDDETIEEHPVYSPGNGRIYFSAYSANAQPGAVREIFSMAPDGSDRRRLTWDGDAVDHDGNSHPFLAPDEGSLFVTTHLDDGTSKVRRISLDGVDLGTVVDSDAEVGHSPAVSASDGEWLYYASDEDGDFELYRLPLNGAGPAEQLTFNADYDAGALPSPEGDRVAFSSSVAAAPCQSDVWVMDADGSNPRQVTPVEDTGFKWPFFWSASDIIYYAWSGTGGEAIWAVPADGSDPWPVIESPGDDQHLLPDATCGFPAPELELTGEPLEGPPGTTVSFDLDTGGGTFVEYEWTFGDGGTAVTTAPSATHTYDDEGVFVVTVNALDSCVPPNETLVELPKVRIDDIRAARCGVAPSPADDDNLCCALQDPQCESDPKSFSGGERVVLNTYWTETLPPDAPGLWFAEWSLGLWSAGLIPIVPLAGVEFDVTGLGGEDVDFCVGHFLVLPDPPQAVPAVLQGFGVTSDNGSIPFDDCNWFDLLPSEGAEEGRAETRVGPGEPAARRRPAAPAG